MRALFFSASLLVFCAASPVSSRADEAQDPVFVCIKKAVAPAGVLLPEIADGETVHISEPYIRPGHGHSGTNLHPGQVVEGREGFSVRYSWKAKDGETYDVEATIGSFPDGSSEELLMLIPSLRIPYTRHTADAAGVYESPDGRVTTYPRSGPAVKPGEVRTTVRRLHGCHGGVS